MKAYLHNQDNASHVSIPIGTHLMGSVNFSSVSLDFDDVFWLLNASKSERDRALNNLSVRLIKEVPQTLRSRAILCKKVGVHCVGIFTAAEWFQDNEAALGVLYREHFLVVARWLEIVRGEDEMGSRVTEAIVSSHALADEAWNRVCMDTFGTSDPQRYDGLTQKKLTAWCRLLVDNEQEKTMIQRLNDEPARPKLSKKKATAYFIEFENGERVAHSDADEALTKDLSCVKQFATKKAARDYGRKESFLKAYPFNNTARSKDDVQRTSWTVLPVPTELVK